MTDAAARIFDFAPNFVLLIALTYIYGLSLAKQGALSRRTRTILNGLLFGLIAVICMELPVRLGEGITIDGRNIIVMLAAPFGGVLAGVIAGLLAAAGRLYLGGAGALAGTAALLAAAAFGIAYSHWMKPQPSTIPLRHIALLALAMTVATLQATFLLPDMALALQILKDISLPLAVVSPVIAVLLSAMLSHEFRRLEMVSELRAKEERLESSQRLAKMGDFIWDIDSGDITWSTPLYELVGYDVGEKIDFTKVNAQLHHPDDVARVREWLSAGIAAGQENLGRNSYRLRHRDGSSIHVQVDARFEMAQGRPVKLIGSCIDVSELVRNAEELATARNESERANRTKSEFLASMSHELRTPLNAVLGYGQMLRLDRQGNLTKTQLGYIDNILTAGQHLLELINDILDLARIEADRLSVRPERVQAGQVIAECVADLDLAARKLNVTLIDEVSAKRPPPILTDRIRFRQIATNLLSNAIKYNKDGGRVVIEAKETKDGYLRLSFADTGIGIPKIKHAEIFQLFHRVSDDPMVTAEGMGIGLAVSKTLAQRLGGCIGFESEVDRGSTFWIDLPLASNQSALIWTDDLRTGVDAIDKDHQILFALANNVAHGDHGSAETERLVEELLTFMRYHFRREEAILKTCGYPDTDDHKARHRDLETRIAEIAEKWRASRDQEKLRELCTVLRDWWCDHIPQLDKTVVRYTEGREDEIRATLAEVA